MNNVFKEIFRVLKAGGHFSISDVVLVGNLPDKLRGAAEMYAGCISGAIQKEEYMALVKENGFTDIMIQKEKAIVIPDDILTGYMLAEEITAFKNAPSGIYSITVFAKKPEACCAPGCCN